MGSKGGMGKNIRKGEEKMTGFILPKLSSKSSSACTHESFFFFEKPLMNQIRYHQPYGPA
jgi:hypothetical protein